MPTVAVTVALAGTIGPPWLATNLNVLRKHVAYAAAKSCSGLLPGPPVPPSSFGVLMLMLRLPSAETATPSRPPVAVAFVV
jgi:hypothetical protein